MRDELTSLILLSAIRISESYRVFVSSWIIIQSLTNVREKTKHTLGGHVTTYILHALRENHVSRLCRPLSAPPTSVCATLIHAQANAYTRTCSHSYAGVSRRRRGVDRRRRRRKQSEEVGKEQWRNRGTSGMYSGSRII